MDGSPPFPHFLFVQGTDPEKPVCKLSPFTIKKSIQSIAGTVKNVTQLRSGNLLIEVDKEAQAKNLLNATSFLNIPIKITPHRSLNSSKGVIRCRELRDCSEQEIIDGLEDQNVIAAHKVMATKENIKSPTNTIFLTFNSSKLPTAIQVGYINVKVDPYIPNPIRCFSCQKFGHLSKNCQKPPACANCGSLEHDFNSCNQLSKCLNCGRDHPSSSKKCEKWIFEKEIQKTKVTLNIPYHEARSKVNPTNQPSYSSVTAQKTTEKKTTTIGTQTEISISPKQKSTNISTQTMTASNPPPTSQRNTSSNLSTSKPQTKPKPNLNSGGRKKGEEDPILLHNKFSVLDGEESGSDDMEIVTAGRSLSPTRSSSPKRKKPKARSPIKGPN
jgi:hypothetical protein